MAGHHSSRSSGSFNWKLMIVIIALVLVVAVLGFLCVNFLLENDKTPEATVAEGITARFAAQDAEGKNVTENLSVAQSSLRPEDIAVDEDALLVDISWAGKREPAMPMILTVSDPSFVNNNGLAVYHFENNQWVLLGTYLIADQSVSFQVESLSPFAFKQISSTPEPTATPEPTPEPIDYGKYDEVQEGLFVQSSGIKEEDSYIIAYVHPVDVEAPEDGEVTVFGDEENTKKRFDATVLVNYDGENLSAVDVQLGKTTDGRYYVIDPVVEGMLWTAVNGDTYNGAERFSLANNEKYLNLDDDNENVVMDDDDYRTRWLYEEVEADGEEFYTLSYRISPSSYFAEIFELTAKEAEETETEKPSKTMTWSVTTDEDDAIELIILRLDDGTADVETKVVSGTLVLMSTPNANSGLNATPVPTAEPDEDDDSDVGFIPVNPTAAPTATPDATEKPADPTATPAVTAEPTTAPTEVPTSSGTTTATAPPSGTNT